MSSRIERPVLTIPQTGSTHRGTVIFLHGSGSTGPELWNQIIYTYPNFPFRHLKVLLPTAPRQPYTPLNGEMSNVWFNRKAISRSCNEIIDSVDLTAAELLDIIKEEVTSGIPMNKIIIGGFSMGGAMAMHMGYRHATELAGVFALSSFFTDDSALHKIRPNEKRMPPLYQWHGARDNMVPLSWGTQTFQSLQDLGVRGEFHVCRNALHELPPESLEKLKKWIQLKLPDVKQPKI